MRHAGSSVRSGDAARARLLADQAARSIAEQRARLAILSDRLDYAARTTITQALTIRVRTDRRLAPALGKLFQMALDG